MEYVGCASCGAVLFRAPGAKCPKCGVRGAGPASSASERLPVTPGAAPDVQGTTTTRRVVLGAAVAGFLGVVGLGYRAGPIFRKRKPAISGTPQAPGAIHGPEERWELTIGRSDWLLTDPRKTMGTVEDVNWDLALGDREDQAAIVLGWVSIPPEHRGEGIDLGGLMASVDDVYRKEHKDYASKQAALAMRGARRQSMELTGTSRVHGPIRGYMAVLAVPARLYILVGVSRPHLFETYRPEFERVFESVFCSA